MQSIRNLLQRSCQIFMHIRNWAAKRSSVVNDAGHMTAFTLYFPRDFLSRKTRYLAPIAQGYHRTLQQWSILLHQNRPGRRGRSLRSTALRAARGPTGSRSSTFSSDSRRAVALTPILTVGLSSHVDGEAYGLGRRWRKSAR
jgi:hypothetical protein